MKKVSTKKIILAAVLAISCTALNAQVKVGSNPTSITTNSNFDIEATTGNRVVVTKDSSKVGIGVTAPTNRLHVKTTKDPVRFEGLQSVAGGVDSVLVVDPTTGVVKYRALGSAATADAASFWKITGNAGTNPGTNALGAAEDGNFWGTTDAKNVVIGTNNVKRMIIDQSGNAYGGKNTTIAAADSNSFAWGNGNTVLGDNSLVVGLSNTDSSKNTFVFGQGNTLGAGGGQTNRGTILGGGGNSVTGGSTYNSVINGSQNTVTGSCFESSVNGYLNNVNGSQKVNVNGQGNTLNNASYSLMLGIGNAENALYGISQGNGNAIGASSDYGTTIGTSNIIKSSSTYGTAIGYGNTINSNDVNCVAIGYNNTIGANQNLSIALGTGVTTTASNQFMAGYSGGYVLYSNIANTVGVSLAANGTTWASISDKRSKENINNIGYGLNTIMKLRPTQYNYKGVKTTSFGFIAQEVKAIMPEVVEQTKMGPNKDYLAIRYSEMIPVLTKAVQELKGENDKLASTNKNLQNELASLKAKMNDLASLAKEVSELKAMVNAKKANNNATASVK